MTLSTDVYVLDEIDAHEVFRFCQGLLTKYDEQHRQPAQQGWSERDGWREDGSRAIGNRIGQGLPAILDVTYRPGAELVTAEQSTQHDEDCDEDCTGRYHRQACWLDVDFDTAYGYKDAEGRGCGDLHALLVAELGQWLDARGVRWQWRNEFTGEVHTGPEKLIELVSGGFEATAWFKTSVLPALMREIGGAS